MKNIRRYFRDHESFIQFQLILRKRILNLYYQINRKRIIRKINKSVTDSVSNDRFLSRLTEMIFIPDTIRIEKPERDAIVLHADKIVSGTYDILGSGEVSIGKIDWHADFKTGYRWVPGKFHRKYNQEDVDNDADVKIPRELSRCHHLLKLATAYKLTKNRKYAEVCTMQILDWIIENPVMYSINWGCTMDVAIRAVNWIWVIRLISDSQILNNDIIERIKVSLYQHGWYIFRNPEKDIINNSNHYLSDLSGQILLGLLFKDISEPKKWLKVGQEEINREIRMQILPTGMSYERSTNYNRLVLELILLPNLVLKRNNYEVPTDIWYRVETMFEFIMYSLKPDGTTPIIGDQDNGRLLPFGTEKLIDFRYLLSIGAVLFNRADFKQQGEGYNIYTALLGGDNSWIKYNEVPDDCTELESKAFPDAGIYIIRKSEDYLLFNATGMGKYPELSPAGHTHSDLLSFELYTLGKSFLVDPGSYVYTANADMRLLFRSTQMHNTLVIDGQSQNNMSRELFWSYDRDAIPDVLNWSNNDSFDTVTATHSGYLRLPAPALHQRMVIYDKKLGKWMINDRVTGRGSHKMEWFFHFDAGIDFNIIDNCIKTICNDGNNIILSFKGRDDINLRKEVAYISKSYGVKESANVLIASLNDILPIELNIEIKKTEE